MQSHFLEPWGTPRTSVCRFLWRLCLRSPCDFGSTAALPELGALLWDVGRQEWPGLRLGLRSLRLWLVLFQGGLGSVPRPSSAESRSHPRFAQQSSQTSGLHRPRCAVHVLSVGCGAERGLWPLPGRWLDGQQLCVSEACQ